MKTRFAIFLTALLSSACLQEDLDPENYEFRGSWDSSRYAIQIFSNGAAYLNVRNRGSLNGHVKINGNRMSFYSQDENDDIGYRQFRIDQRPTTDANGETYMVLDGHRLVRH